MRRGTTSKITFSVKKDLTYARIWVIVQQNGNTITKKTNEELTITAEAITCPLSQEETLAMKMGTKVETQLRFVFANGEAGATEVFTFKPERILEEEVIQYYA